MFIPNSGIHSINTWHCRDLQPPLLHLPTSPKSVYFSSIKIFNHLPVHIQRSILWRKKIQTCIKKISLVGLILFNWGIFWLGFNIQSWYNEELISYHMCNNPLFDLVMWGINKLSQVQ
jgi:hypothetical protein